VKVLVIGGGISDEREVSLRSSASVYEAVSSLGYEAEYYDWRGGYEWLENNIGRFKVILPILHGRGGEDGQIQQFLESKNKLFLGTKAESSKVCFSKVDTKKVLHSHLINTPNGEEVGYDQYITSELSDSLHILKPNEGGSSIDMLIGVKKQDVDPVLLKKLFLKHKTMLLEQFISGNEITVPVLDGYDLPVIEIIPPTGETFDYANKYNGKTRELCPPIHVSQALQNEAIELAKRAHKALGCRHISRVDIIISDKEFYVLEVNTMPGLTSKSLFPLSAEVAEMDMPKLMSYCIDLVCGKR
jgi:D-alanine-D-alanine ligase